MSLYNQIVLGCSLFELLWIRYTYELMLAMWLLRHSTIHHGRCSRRTSELLIHVKCVDAVELAFTATMVIPAGDFNTLPQDDGMTVNWSMECISSIIVSQPVRGVNKLDRMYVSKLIYTYYIIFFPDFTSVKVVTSTGISGHKENLSSRIRQSRQQTRHSSC